MIGTTISHYKITEKLGGGGMGVVYKARDLKLDRFVALKFLPQELSTEEEHNQRFIHEAKAASALDHPNICTIYEISESEDRQTFIAMAYYQGETLKKKIERRPLPLPEVLELAMQVGQGLAKAHEQDIVHRDIKPANLMVTSDGVVKIVDFGLARLSDATQLTQTGSTLGTPAYMSPEQALGERVDRRSDIWSLGVVLYEMVTGQQPFGGERQEAVLYGISNEEPEPVTALRAGLPMELERIIGKALAKDRNERYQHSEDLLVDLRGLQKKLESGRSAVRRQPEPTAVPVSAQKPWLPWVLLAATAIALVIVSVFAFQQEIPEVPLRRFAFATPAPVPTGIFNNHLTISPNGRHIAFVAQGRQKKLWVQDLDREKPRAIEGTEGAYDPFWSPDSKWIAFRASGDSISSPSKVVLSPGFAEFRPGFSVELGARTAN